MLLVLVFACVLLASVLVSGLANRSVLSTAVLFLTAGFLLGDGVSGAIEVRADQNLVASLAEFALFSVLFTDGMRVGFPELRSAWRLPGRALVLGLPLSLGITAVLAHVLTGLPWAESFLLGAVLSPTDPVFAAAIVGRDLGAELIGGVAIGVGVPAIAIRLERTRLFSASVTYEPLNAFAIGLIVLALASLTQTNVFLAAFSADITVATMSPAIRSAFDQFGELVAELLKLAALLVFGALISPSFLADIPLNGYLFAAAALLVARPRPSASPSSAAACPAANASPRHGSDPKDSPRSYTDY